jgi:hypothetical protein
MDTSVLVEDAEYRPETTHEVNLEVLHPENPLMIRFQKALKQQLEKRLENIRENISQNVRFPRVDIVRYAQNCIRLLL